MTAAVGLEVAEEVVGRVGVVGFGVEAGEDQPVLGSHLGVEVAEVVEVVEVVEVDVAGVVGGFLLVAGHQFLQNPFQRKLKSLKKEKETAEAMAGDAC